MRVGGHDDVAAESLDSLTDTFVVGGHPELVHGGAYAFVDALNHGFTAQVGQRFAGEARRGVTRGDDAKEVHGDISSYRPLAGELCGFRRGSQGKLQVGRENKQPNRLGAVRLLSCFMA